jgi:hypothetical protein
MNPPLIEPALNLSFLHESRGSTLDTLFSGRLYVTIEETARILDLDVKTLRGLCEAGRIDFIVVGSGRLRPRRRFTQEHVAAFLSGGSPKTFSSPHRSDVRAAVRRRLRELE